MMDPNNTIVAIGSSVRACTQSIRRAGYNAIGYDHFADRHEKPETSIEQVSPTPKPWAEIIRRHAGCKLMTTGPLENDPDTLILAEELCDNLGTPATSLQYLRDPFWVDDRLRDVAIPTLVISRNLTTNDTHTWLQKPYQSGGGYAIKIAKIDSDINNGVYYQQYVHGTPYSAVLITLQDRHYLVGISMILAGYAYGANAPFGYAGNIGPHQISDDLNEWLMRVVHAVTKSVTVRGIWGIDFIESEGEFYLLEINPRYTSSVEVYELATGRSLVKELLSSRIGKTITQPNQIVGKWIYYSPVDQVVSSTTFDYLADYTQDSIRYTDVPYETTSFKLGDPMFTIITHGNTVQKCHDRLCNNIKQITRYIDSH